MHGVAVHSALAIKRQRKRQDEAARRGRRRAANKPVSEANLGGGSNSGPKVIGTVTTLHVGIIFCLIGFLFLVSAAIPSQTTSKNEWFNLVATGATCIAIGTFLVCLNRFYGNKEEQELSDYVEAQLGRTTSGHRLVRDQSEINVAAPQAPSPAVAHTSLEQINEDSGRKDKYRVYDKQRRMSSKKQLMQQQPPQELQEQPLQ